MRCILRALYIQHRDEIRIMRLVDLAVRGGDRLGEFRGRRFAHQSGFKDDEIVQRHMLADRLGLLGNEVGQRRRRAATRRKKHDLWSE